MAAKPSRTPRINPKGYVVNPIWGEVDNYTFDHLHSKTSTPSVAILDEGSERSNAANLPTISVSYPQGKFLMLQARMIAAKSILEVGTLGGLSSIWFANATPTTHVTTLEISPEFAAVAKENWKAAGVEDRIELCLGSAVDILPKLVEEVEKGERTKWDLVFIDADKENGWEYYDRAVKGCRSGACVIVDNVVMKGSLVDKEMIEQHVRVRKSRELVERVGKDERVDGVVMQTVGEKNWDGFFMAVVK